MITVGLTGGIGSGKSTTARIFQKLGARVIFADDLAKDFLVTDRQIKKSVIREFGSAICPDGRTINRALLADIVFHHPSALRKLNSIIHPRVIQALKKEILGAKSRRMVLMIEAALFYEAGIAGLVDYIIVVDAERELRIRRVMNRDGCSRTSVIRRMMAQMPAGTKARRADIVVKNSGDETELEDRCRFAFRLLSKLDPMKGQG